jgi:hypothetical protein
MTSRRIFLSLVLILFLGTGFWLSREHFSGPFCGLLTEKTCELSDNCYKKVGPSGCSEDGSICTADVQYKGCEDITEEMRTATVEKQNSCESTGGVWEAGRVSGRCSCPDGYSNYNRECHSTIGLCEEAGGAWYKAEEPFCGSIDEPYVCKSRDFDTCICPNGKVWGLLKCESE